MHLILWSLSVAVLALAASVPASGQDFLKREVFGSIGIGKTYDDEGSLGKGLNGGGGIGYRLSRRFGVEMDVNAFRTKREFSPAFPPFRASGAFLMGNGLWYFNGGRAQGYLIFGAGLLHYRGETGFAGPADRTGNGFAVNIGTGLKIFATPRFSLRPELRILGGSGGGAVEAPFSDLRISMGAGYHW